MINNILISEPSCSSNLLEKASSLHTNIHPLAKIDICGMYSLPNDIGIKHVDGYRVSKNKNHRGCLILTRKQLK